MHYRKEQKRSHALRYVLKNRKTDKVYMVVLFTLYLKEDVDEDGNVKVGVEAGKPGYGGALEEDVETEDKEAAQEEIKKKDEAENNDDDID